MKNKATFITAVMAILADIVTLIAFGTDFLQSDTSSFIMHPAFWIILQFSFTVYGNLFFGYWAILRLGELYKNRQKYSPRETEKTLKLVIYLVWVPTCTIWITTVYLITNPMWGGPVFVPLVFASIFVIPFGGMLLAQGCVLLARTFHPDLAIEKLVKEDLLSRTYY